MNSEIENELNNTVKYIVKNLEKHYENNEWEEFVNDAIDITIEKYINDNEISGFSVLLAFGNPIIEWLYHRGTTYIIASWSGKSIIQPLDSKIADSFLNFLNETVKF